MQWMKTKSVLPTPANILDLCEREFIRQSRHDPETMAARDRTAKRLRDENKKKGDFLSRMTEEEFNTWLERMKENLKTEHVREIGKIDTSHFDKLNDEQKKQMTALTIELSKKPKF